MRFLAFIPHRHRWHEINITRQGAVSPNGRTYLSTYITASCKSCGEMIHRIYYRDISDEQARRWLG
ncbi:MULTISPECIES: yippee family protein [unclassified Pantoea]|uniref:yippee family protein n=1 Tax=Pantoea TaxID=53335 RepID=UPI001FAA8B4D|nr:yippee family protein [Pantoea sp. MQR6]